MVGKRAAGAIKMAAPRSRCWWTVVRIERQREHHLRRARRVPLPRDGVISQTPTNQSKQRALLVCWVMVWRKLSVAVIDLGESDNFN